jgi:tetratricopeptide (TPR) repeat protein
VQQQQRFQVLVKMKPRILPLNMLLGAQLAQNKWKSAIQTTASLRELEPKNDVWWRQLVALYMQTDDHRNALITLQQADRAKLVLSNQQLTLMAQLYAQSGVPYQAANTFLRLTNIDQDLELMVQQAIYWQQAKEWQLALQQWDRVANIKPQYYREYALLAIQQRELENALTAIDKIPNKDASLLVIKAQILHEMGNVQGALNTITLAHQISPSDNTETWLRFLTQTQTVQ